ncbi:MAG: ABC transporter substrate-binding protein [Oscillospiraceae bacterium]|nr:ABC transporter substrate-binding protein [Oscillospiraceae bacterium]
MTKRYNRIIAVAIAVIMSLVLVAACATEYETAAPTPAPTPAPATGNETQGTDGDETVATGPREINQNNILRFGTTSLDGLFNPTVSSNVYDSYVVSLIFEGLVTNNAGGEFIPNIADWELSSDNLTYTFTLHEGITFSDGTPMTASDVAFTYNVFAHPEYTGVRGYVVVDFEGHDEFKDGTADSISGINVIDERTISFTYAEGTASPANIANFGYGIMPEHYYAFDAWDDFAAKFDQPMGSGWFVFQEWRDKEFLLLHTNFDYWKPADIPLIDGVIFLDIPDESLAGAFMTDQVDVANPGASLDNQAAFATIDGIDVRVIEGNSYNFMQFNTLIPQLEDYRVRQALLYALDREAFVTAAYGALGSVGLSPISPVSWAFNPDGMNPYAFDLDKANELMEDAGWVMGGDGVRTKDGNRMAITWLVYPEAAWPGILSGLAADTWPQIGVDLTIEIMDFNTVGDRSLSASSNAERDFEMFTMGWSMAIDPDLTGGIFGLDEMALGDGGFNASGWRNEEYARKMEDAKQSFDQAKRTELYNEISAMYNEQVPTVVVALRSVMWPVADRVGNLDISTYVDWTYHINKVTLDH